jgi:hypothetical protein
MMQTLQTIEIGWDVVGSDDQKIGSVNEIGEGFVLVRQGHIFAKDIYIPTDAITAADVDRRTVVINIPKAAAENMGWNSPPEVALPPIGSTPGMTPAAPAESFSMPPARDLRTPEESLLEERTTEEANAASTGWEGATEVVKDDFEREELRRQGTKTVLPPPVGH